MVQKEDEERAPPKDPSAADLLTAQDIFGEVLESLGETYAPPQATAAGSERRSPIKVQVSEPGAAETPALAATADSERVLPEELASLLEAFDPLPPPLGPTVASDAAAAPADAAADLPPEPPPPTPEPGAEGAPGPADAADDEVVESVLPPGADNGEPDLQPPLEAPSRPPKAPRARRKQRPGFSPEEALRDLQNLRPPFLPPKPAPGPIDLASVVEQALGAAAGGKGRTVAEPIADRIYGPYRLLQKIAVGGMAEVFKAKRTGVEGFEKVVAVKRILPHLSDNKEFVDMFIDEAKMVAGLTHPNIVQISDLGKIDRSYYIAMEYVHGRDLRSILRRAKERGLRLPLDLTVLIVSRVCSALEFAHRKKDERGRPMLIVHRDISPQNILISFEGEVKLTDFGIAKAATKARITDAGALRGKLLYMSPEQAWGKPMDRRSDLFSLGIVFYEMITDQKPFLGSSEMSILEMVRECRIAPPSDVNPRIPERLEKVVMTALDREPDHRYQDASQMYRDLDRVLHERQPPTAVELSRFLELLFDEDERSDARPEEQGEPSPSRAPGMASEEGGAAAREAEGPAAVEGPDPGGIKDPLSIQKLLKRFGIT
jgi:serine/threonine protein kinase